MVSPGFHALFNFHRFVRARHHSHKHLSRLWVVLSLQVFINTILYIHSQSCWLQPYGENTIEDIWKNCQLKKMMFLVRAGSCLHTCHNEYRTTNNRRPATEGCPCRRRKIEMGICSPFVNGSGLYQHVVDAHETKWSQHIVKHIVDGWFDIKVHQQRERY